MQRENFYILLDLSVNPPEQNSEIIESAIKKKQAEWSKFRNHPTKGMKAKQYIEMISEIRKVMTNEALRNQEAQNALEIKQQSEKNKYEELDHQIDILNTKGHITDDEIDKLLGLHSFTKAEIEKRIALKENEKLTEIDKHLNIRMGKGYITEEEIIKLSKLHAVDATKIRDRVVGPILDSKSKINKPKPLDQSLEKIIHENLNIIGKTSLYDFLGAKGSLDIASLQQITKDKESEILKSSKKDAVITASSILIGHCHTIFKSEETRRSYDASYAKLDLSKFNKDIAAAELNGKIRKEYFEILLKTAANYGLDTEEATTHIKKYCECKHWTIEIPNVSKKTPNRWLLVSSITGIIVIILISIVLTLQIAKTRQKNNEANRIESEFNTLLAKVNAQQDLNKQKKMLEMYIQSHTKNQYTLEAENKIKLISNKIEEPEYQLTVQKVENFIKNHQFEEAQNVCKQFLLTHPQGVFASQIQKLSNEIPQQIENWTYAQAISEDNTSILNKVDKYQQFLIQYPNSNHKTDIEKRKEASKNAYLEQMKQYLAELEHAQKWQEAFQLCKNYTDYYPNSAEVPQVQKLQQIYQSRILELGTLTYYLRQHQFEQADYQNQQKIYKDFLNEHPEFFMKDDIIKKIEELKHKEKLAKNLEKEQLIEKELAKTNGRFTLHKNGYIVDHQTGLIWCILDTHLGINTCLSYEDASNHVKQLSCGNLNNWRLPKVNELVSLFKSKPSFPVKTSPWYWSSQFSKSYADGWTKKVDTVTSEANSDETSTQIDSRECGGVCAVRSAK
ncbi:MAG: DUF1566 domain-containing protein [Desulfobacterales bacterium]|nr:DUF1566 domain-containing protein [Desulfobacterales bacterium]